MLLASENRKARRPETPDMYVEVLRQADDGRVRHERSPLVVR